MNGYKKIEILESKFPPVNKHNWWYNPYEGILKKYTGGAWVGIDTKLPEPSVPSKPSESSYPNQTDDEIWIFYTPNNEEGWAYYYPTIRCVGEEYIEEGDGYYNEVEKSCTWTDDSHTKCIIKISESEFNRGYRIVISTEGGPDYDGSISIVFPNSWTTLPSGDSPSDSSSLPYDATGTIIFPYDGIFFNGIEVNIGENIEYLPMPLIHLTMNDFFESMDRPVINIFTETPPELSSGATNLVVGAMESSMTYNLNVPKGTRDDYQNDTNWASVRDDINEME